MTSSDAIRRYHGFTFMIRVSSTIVFCIALCFLLSANRAAAQGVSQASVFGPYNAVFLASGLGFEPHTAAAIEAPATWTIATWIQADDPKVHTLIGGIGETETAGVARYLALDNGHVAVWLGSTETITSPAALTPRHWHFVAATDDGSSVRLFVDGKDVGGGAAPTTASARGVHVAPAKLPWTDGQHFAGRLAQFVILDHALTSAEMQPLFAAGLQPTLIVFDTPSHEWPVQTHQQAGYRSPQDPATLPHSNAAPSQPVAKPVTDPVAALAPRGANEWAIAGGWQLTPEPKAHSDGATVSQNGFDASSWLHATVPGTVLTTYVDRGIYPDPDFGLNNLAIPESLSRQSYWYRVDFTPPGNLRRRHLTLTFNGINYAAEVWLNGERLGNIKGAFIRGIFDVTKTMKPGEKNTLAVLIAPPPHPGIPQEQSIKGGPGENGGIMCLDGPTFVATEGWDWIPGIRDRNSGLWQEVTLRATEAVRIGDPQVVTALPLPDTSHADVFIAVPLHNDSDNPEEGTLVASFEGVKVTKRLTADPGDSVVRLTPVEFHDLSVAHPRLWWPNGYGKPELYHLNLSFRSGSHDSDVKSLRFGIREITYELSLLDSTGHLRRVEISPTEAAGQEVINVLHEGMIQSAEGWVASLAPGADNSPAVRPVGDTGIAPYLAIKVNGVRIACKGGNWGMDDSRKRVSREHTEPYFRLHRDAHLNIIRNWVGQDTEETFYDLADEYGLLVWNDFWDSTENYNAEPDDAGLFLANARDVLLRFRNHPSIVLWCGRNEGVPSPAINRGLDELIRRLDGTRYYSPSSNVVNLQNSGPYRLQSLSEYFTKNAKGFAVELGVPSVPTIDTMKSFLAPADQWPPNDVWAYHDWHASGNGVVAPFMEMLETQYGAGTDLEDFERKAQIINYDSHRAIFEGFNAHLWKPNSGRMLWMTQPAWPSTMWQIFSSDYDTQASYYGVKSASEFVHVQMNLPDLSVGIVNETVAALDNVTVRARVISRGGAVLFSKEEKLSVPASSEVDSFGLPVEESANDDVVFVRLELLDASGGVLSQNFYAHATVPATYRRLNELPSVTLSAVAKQSDGSHITVDLTNSGSSVAFMSKLTLRSAADGSRILPAYYSDNYVSLVPGETRTVSIEAPSTATHGPLAVGLSGWNIASNQVAVGR